MDIAPALRNELMKAAKGGCTFPVLIRWLGLKSTEKRDVARTILYGFGEEAIERLIKEAIKPGKQPDHRIAILDIVVRIGKPLGPTAFFQLQSLLRHRVPRVAAKAAEVFVALSACGQPGGAAAAFVGLHPAFWLPPKRARRPSFLRLYKEHCKRRARGDY